jgi:hypothetical protein
MSVTNPHKRKTPPPVNCASGTAHNDGAKIHAAINQQQLRALRYHPAKTREAREWRKMYEEAMALKRATQSKEIAE